MGTETATMPDYSHLIGKRVRIKDMPHGARCAGRLESCKEIGPGVIACWIKRRGAAVAMFVGGHFELESAS